MSCMSPNIADDQYEFLVWRSKWISRLTVQNPRTWLRSRCPKDGSPLMSWPTSKATSTQNLALRTGWSYTCKGVYEISRYYLRQTGNLEHLRHTSPGVEWVATIMGRLYLNVGQRNEGVRLYVCVIRYMTIYGGVIRAHYISNPGYPSTYPKACNVFRIICQSG